MTVRMATCSELAQDAEAIERMAKSYWDAEKSATPTRLLLPWLRSPSKKLYQSSTTDLYLLFLKYVQDRRTAGADSNDPIDILIRNGDTDNDIVKVSLNTIPVARDLPLKYLAYHWCYVCGCSEYWC